METSRDGSWSITIKATYYVKKDDKKSKESANRAVQSWNDKSGGFILRSGNKEDKIDYSINFNFQVMEVDDPDAEKKRINQEMKML